MSPESSHIVLIDDWSFFPPGSAGPRRFVDATCIAPQKPWSASGVKRYKR